MDTELLLITMTAAVITMLATGLGALPFYLFPTLPEVWARRGYAFAGGVMLAASVFDLIFPAINRGGYVPAMVGLSAGTLFFIVSEYVVDDQEFHIGKIRGASAQRIVLILGTLFIHSFPEGMAIGVGYGAESSGDQGLGLLLAIAISLQNIPEGLAVALPLRAEGVSVNRCVLLAIVSSLPQPLAALPALFAVTLVQQLLPYALTFAAGAMGFLVFSELIPEGVCGGDRTIMGAVIAASFLLMMGLHLVV